MLDLDLEFPYPDRHPSHVDAILQLLGGQAALGAGVSSTENLLSAVSNGLPGEPVPRDAVPRDIRDAAGSR